MSRKPIRCDNLPTIHWWSPKKRIITAEDGCQWHPYYILYPEGLRSSWSPGFWTWTPVFLREAHDERPPPVA